MSSLKAFLRDYIQFNYDVPEIVDHYIEWVKDSKYMILVRWNREKLKNEVFARAIINNAGNTAKRL
jgi:hypothetical protein